MKIPVTVKTRLGWDHNNRVIVELAEQLQDCGIAAITVHGRTRSQMYTGEADWDMIARVKENPRLTIPVIGNGDIDSPERLRDAFGRYGVDGVMVGRAPSAIRGYSMNSSMASTRPTAATNPFRWSRNSP